MTSPSGLSSVSHVAAGSCLAVPLLSLLLWPPKDGSPSPWAWQGCRASPLTNGIDNVTCEDEDVSKVCVFVDQIRQTDRLTAFAQTDRLTEDDHQPD